MTRFMTADAQSRLGRCAPFAVLFAIGYNIFFLGKVGPSVAADFHVRVGDLTQVFFATQVGLALGSLSLGYVCSRVGRLRAMATSMMVSAILNALMPLVPDFNVFIIMRAISCLGLGLAFPGALSAIATARPGSPAIGFGLACQILGNLAATAFTAWALDRLGWGPGVWLGSMLSLLTLPLICIMTLDHDPANRIPHPGLPREQRTAAMILAACFLGTIAVTTMLGSWGATWFYRYQGVALSRFASFSVFAVLGNLAGLMASGFIARRFPLNLCLPVLLVVQACALMAMGWGAFGTAPFVAALAIGAMTQSAGQGILNAVVAWTFPNPQHSAAFGYMASSARIGGLMGSAGGGILLAHHVPLAAIFLMSALICMAIAIAFLLATRLGFLLQHPITRTS